MSDPSISDVPSTPTTQAAPEQPATTAGIIAELQAERKARQGLAARLAEVEPIVAAHQGLAEQHAAVVAEIKATNERRLAALPEAHRAVIAALPKGASEIEIARTIDALASIVQPTGQAAPVAPYPAGVQSPAGTPAPDELTPAERTWVETERRTLIGASAATIRAIFNKHGPGAKKTSG